MQLTHPDLEPSSALLRCTGTLILGIVNPGRGGSRTAHHRADNPTRARRRRRFSLSLDGEDLDYPLVPHFAVIRLAVHCYDEFAIVRNVQGCLIQC